MVGGETHWSRGTWPPLRHVVISVSSDWMYECKIDSSNLDFRKSAFNSAADSSMFILALFLMDLALFVECCN